MNVHPVTTSQRAIDTNVTLATAAHCSQHGFFIICTLPSVLVSNRLDWAALWAAHCVHFELRDNGPEDDTKLHSVGLLVSVVLFTCEANVRCDCGHTGARHQKDTASTLRFKACDNTHTCGNDPNFFATRLRSCSSYLVGLTSSYSHSRCGSFSRAVAVMSVFDECGRCLVCHSSTLRCACSTCSWEQHNTNHLGS